MSESEQFAKAWEKVQANFGLIYKKLKDSGASRERIIRELTDLDIENLLLNEFNLNGEIDLLMKGYVKELKSIQAFSDISEDIIKSLIVSDSVFYKSKIIESGNAIKSTMIQSIINNLDEQDFAVRLTQVGLQPHQANALANDSIRRFSRSVSNEMANNMPKNALYIWEGPIDNKTSDACLRLMGLGPMTRQEFESAFPGAFVNGTHFNCRHQAQRFLSKKQFKGSLIKKQIANA